MAHRNSLLAVYWFITKDTTQEEPKACLGKIEGGEEAKSFHAFFGPGHITLSTPLGVRPSQSTQLDHLVVSLEAALYRHH